MDPLNPKPWSHGMHSFVKVADQSGPRDMLPLTVSMWPTLQAQWETFLREHPERQFRNALRGPGDKRCCLGAACDLIGDPDWQELPGGTWLIRGHVGTLPDPERLTLGLRSCVGQFDPKDLPDGPLKEKILRHLEKTERGANLAWMNDLPDNGERNESEPNAAMTVFTWTDIADVIAARPRGLFLEVIPNADGTTKEG